MRERVPRSILALEPHGFAQLKTLHRTPFNCARTASFDPGDLLPSRFKVYLVIRCYLWGLRVPP